MSEQIELKPCPFCGKQPHCGTAFGRDEDQPNAFNFQCPDGCSVTRDASTYEGAIVLWNTRDSSPVDVQHAADFLMVELDKLGMHITYTACKKIVEGLLSIFSGAPEQL